MQMTASYWRLITPGYTVRTAPNATREILTEMRPTQTRLAAVIVDEARYGDILKALVRAHQRLSGHTTHSLDWNGESTVYLIFKSHVSLEEAEKLLIEIDY